MFESEVQKRRSQIIDGIARKMQVRAPWPKRFAWAWSTAKRAAEAHRRADEWEAHVRTKNWVIAPRAK